MLVFVTLVNDAVAATSRGRSRSGMPAELHEVRVLSEAAQRPIADVGDAAVGRDRSQLRGQRACVRRAGVASGLQREVPRTDRDPAAYVVRVDDLWQQLTRGPGH